MIKNRFGISFLLLCLIFNALFLVWVKDPALFSGFEGFFLISGQILTGLGYLITASMVGCDWKLGFCFQQGVPGYLIALVFLLIFYYLIGLLVGLAYERFRRG